MRSQLEPATGATALFIQGATGNQNPLAMGHDYAHAATTGERLAIEAQRLWESIVPVRAKALAVSRTQVELPGIRYGSRENAARLLDASRRELEQLTSRDGTQPAHRRWLERLVERAEAALRSWDTAEQPPRVVASVGAVQFGPVALVAAAGEIFAEVGSEVKAKAPTPHTLFAAYTNGDVGYVPTPEAYPEGGYEVERACRVDPEAAPLITEACLDVLRRVRT
jgi:hypothetical protein